MEKIILASKSPRRRELLERFQIPFEIICEEVDESNYESKLPSDVVMELATMKAKAIGVNHPTRTILAADTVVVFEGEILGKPTDKNEAQNMMRMLSGQTHEVLTGWCCIHSGEIESYVETTQVKFYDNDENWIDKYLAFEEYADKAGAYGIQGAGAMLVQSINGDFYNVMGLPIGSILKYLSEKKIIR